MATLKTTTSGKVSREVRIPADEVQAILRDKFRVIPANARMGFYSDEHGEGDPLAVLFCWEDSTNANDEADLVPGRSSKPKKGE